MTETKVHYNGEEFQFRIVDAHGEVHEFTLHTVGTIGLIRELKRETDMKLSVQQTSMRPLLRLLRGGDC